MSDISETAELVTTVYIDQNTCCGGLACTDFAKDLFVTGETGYTHVVENGRTTAAGEAGKIIVPLALEDAVFRAAEACPGQCIIVQKEVWVPVSNTLPTTSSGQVQAEGV
jgi:ferredoxin